MKLLKLLSEKKIGKLEIISISIDFYLDWKYLFSQEWWTWIFPRERWKQQCFSANSDGVELVVMILNPQIGLKAQLEWT